VLGIPMGTVMSRLARSQHWESLSRHLPNEQAPSLVTVICTFGGAWLLKLVRKTCHSWEAKSRPAELFDEFGTVHSSEVSGRSRGKTGFARKLRIPYRDTLSLCIVYSIRIRVN
jgi:hypothetical protein